MVDSPHPDANPQPQPSTPPARPDATSPGVTRRDAIGMLGAAGAGFLAACSTPGAMAQPATQPAAAAGPMGAAMLGYDPDADQYTLPPLAYPYDALEPSIDEATMRLHHSKHHQGYVNGLNRSLRALAEARRSGDFALVQKLSRDVAFHGSGHLLHTVFWQNMAPPGRGGGGEPTDELAAKLTEDFGSVDAMKAHFSAAAKAVEASGWGLLVYEPVAGQCLVMQAEKHQNLTAWGVVPLLALDVWEHAYYLKYQNNRGAYVDAFWNVVNWKDVARRLSWHSHAHDR